MQRKREKKKEKRNSNKEPTPADSDRSYCNISEGKLSKWKVEISKILAYAMFGYTDVMIVNYFNSVYLLYSDSG